MSGTACFKKSNPIKSKAKPIKNSAQNRQFPFLINIIGRATAIIGKAIATIFILKPSVDTSHAVMVVPILAPIIIPADCNKLNRPALTKLTVITVVAEEDCTSAVIMKPESTPK